MTLSAGAAFRSGAPDLISSSLPIPRAAQAWRRAAAIVYVTVLVLVGLILTGGGAWLIALGGSPYYALCGLSVLASGILVRRGDRRGAWVYIAMFSATITWSLYEVSFDIWALPPASSPLSCWGFPWPL